MRNLLLLASLFAITTYAAAPVRCPAVDKIQDIGLSDNLVRDADGKWYAGRTAEKYGTDELWTFVIGGISAHTKQEAVLEANEALATLRYHSGPERAPAEKWLCLYMNDEELLSAAVTPPANALEPLRK